MTEDQERPEFTNREIIFFYIIVLVLFIAGCTMSFLQAYDRGQSQYEKEYFALIEKDSFDRQTAAANAKKEMGLKENFPVPEARKKEFDLLLEKSREAHAEKLDRKKRLLAEKHRFLFIREYPVPDGKVSSK